MSEQYLNTIAAAKPALNPAAGVLQRKCACSQHTIAGGECEECRKKKASFQTYASASVRRTPPPTVQDGLNSSDQPLDSATRNHVRDFTRISTFLPNQATRTAAQRTLTGDQDAHSKRAGGSVIVKDYRNPEEEQPPVPETAKTGNQPAQARASQIGPSKKLASADTSWGDTRNSSRSLGGQFASPSPSRAHPKPVSWAALQLLPKNRGARGVLGPPAATGMGAVWASGGKGAAGVTDNPSGYKAPDFEFNTKATGTDWSSQPTAKTAAVEPTGNSIYTAAGKYKTGEMEGGKDVYWNFSPSISDMIKTGEQEHCDDDTEAYRISLKEADTVLNAHIIGKTFGPKASKADAENLVLAEIKAKLTHPELGNDKTQWVAKFLTLDSKSLIRDSSGWHSISTGARSVDGAGNVIYEIVKGTSKIPGPASSAIIKY